MKTKFIFSLLTGSIALALSSCSSSKLAVQASNDDVYFSEVEARPIIYSSKPSREYRPEEYSRNNDSYYEEEYYNPRIDINNRNNYSWRDYYYNSNLAYDPFFYDPLFAPRFNNFYRPGFSVGLGWNSWGWNSGWSLGFNNWGWNNWGYNNFSYNPWYSPYNSPYWGIYSYYSPFGYGYGNGYYGGGLYPGTTIITSRPNNPRPVRGGEGARSNTNDGNVSRIPRPNGPISSVDTRSSSGRPSRESGSSSGSMQRPSDTQSTRPSRTETESRPSRTEERPTRSERPQPTYTPSTRSDAPSSSGGSRSSGSSSEGSSSRPSRPRN